MKGELEHLRKKVTELEQFKVNYERTEKVLQQCEERFQKLFHASSTPMAIT